MNIEKEYAVLRGPDCRVFGSSIYGRIQLPDREPWFFVWEPLTDEGPQRIRIKQELTDFRESFFAKDETGFSQWVAATGSPLKIGMPPPYLESMKELSKGSA